MKMQSELPLLDLKVLELGGVLAVPYVTMMLSDMGAEVIKVEKIHGGDDTRNWSPPSVGGQSAYFLSVNRGKKSIAIDIKTKKGQEIVRELARTSDLVVENFRRRALEKYGLGCAALRKLNPMLITCAIKGFARGTPKEDDPGYDLGTQARFGLMSVTGSNGPTKVGAPLADIITALFALSGINAAFYGREKEKVGTHVEVALSSAMVAAMVTIAQNYFVSEKVPGRYGNAHPNIVPYQSFSAQDGRDFVLAVGNDKQWRALCQALKRDDLNAEARFATNELRVLNRTELVGILTKEFLTRPRDHWVSLVETAGIPGGPIQDIAEVLDDPNVQQAGMIAETQHPTAGLVHGINCPIDFCGTGIRQVNHIPAPLLGEHTNDILIVLGYKEKEIEQLRSEGIVA
ncbi:CoA transferase [Candidatus Kaiserbacteria bacterium]|nr:CoA transferase [Candidatus Kaiserbacteria bacterium]